MLRSWCFALVFVLAGLVPALAPPPAAAADEKEAYYGFNLDLIAKSFSRLGAFHTQYGDREGDAHFAAWLREIGQTRERFDAAYSAWWARWKADPTGESEARFHTLDSKYSQELHFGDAPRRDQEAHEGVTLDRYAKISVALSRPGADTAKVLRQNGINSQERWQRINDAWGKAMKEDTSFALVQQYGALFQKYAGPEFAAKQEKQLADTLAAHNREPPPPRTEPPPPPGLEDLAKRLQAPSPKDRWAAAREIARQCSLWAGPGRGNPADPKAHSCAPQVLRERLVPAAIDALDHHDDDTMNYATGMLDFLVDLNLKDAGVRAAIERAVSRDKVRLAQLEAQFAPIQDKGVPERVFLRPKIDGYRQTIKDLEHALNAW
jgi:hypothetical protein